MVEFLELMFAEICFQIESCCVFAQHCNKSYISLSGRRLHYFSVSPCWIFFPPLSPRYLVCLYFIFFPQQIMPYHHILPASLISSISFPLLHYSIFHFDSHFCLCALPPNLIPSPVHSSFFHSLFILQVNLTNLLLRNLSSEFYTH